MKRLPDDYECDGQIDLMDYIPRRNKFPDCCDGCKCNLGYDNVWCEHAQRHNCPVEGGDCKGLKPHAWPDCSYYRKECIYYKPNSLHLENCLNAVLTCYDDGTKLCPLIDSWGCVECMEVWERSHKDD
jgi:hypothetical protein